MVTEEEKNMKWHVLRKKRYFLDSRAYRQDVVRWRGGDRGEFYDGESCLKYTNINFKGYAYVTILSI